MTYRASQHKTGLSASRPTATGSGQMYACTDFPNVYIDDPVSKSWKQFASEYMVSPPPVSNLTVVNSGNGISIAQYGDAIRAMVAADSTNVNGVALASGSLSSTSPWIVTLKAAWTPNYNKTFPFLGPCVSNGTTSGTSQCWAYGNYWDAAYAYHGFNDVIGTGTRNNVYNEITSPVLQYSYSNTHGLLRFRLLNDGVNMHMQIGIDANNYSDIYTIACPSGLNHYGFFLGTEDGGGSSWGQATIYENALLPLTVGQQTISTWTGNGTTTTINVASTAGLQAGDYVAVQGSGNATLNGSVNVTFNINGSGWLITSIPSATQLKISNSVNTSGTGGTITLLSR